MFPEYLKEYYVTGVDGKPPIFSPVSWSNHKSLISGEACTNNHQVIF